MVALIDIVSQPLCQSLFSDSLSPNDLEYWIGGRLSGSLGLHWQLLGFIATVVMIAWKSAEMNNKPMLIAGILTCVSLTAFVYVGFALTKQDARMVCFLLNMFQGLVFCILMIHWRIHTMSRF